MSGILFDPGRIVMTPGAVKAMRESKQKPSEFILRHIRMDRGELDSRDHRENLSALKTGLRVFNHYKTAQGVELWVISEWVNTQEGGKPNQRELTTLFLPSEY